MSTLNKMATNPLAGDYKSPSQRSRIANPPERVVGLIGHVNLSQRVLSPWTL